MLPSAIVIKSMTWRRRTKSSVCKTTKHQQSTQESVIHLTEQYVCWRIQNLLPIHLEVATDQILCLEGVWITVSSLGKLTILWRLWIPHRFFTWKNSPFSALSQILRRKGDKLRCKPAQGRWAKMAAVHITPLRSMELSGSGSNWFCGVRSTRIKFYKTPPQEMSVPMVCFFYNHQRYELHRRGSKKNDLYSKCCLNLLLEQRMDFL